MKIRSNRSGDIRSSAWSADTDLNPLLTICAVAAGIGGALRICSTVVTHVPRSAVHELLYAVIDTGLLFGLIGVYLATAARTGRIGLAAFAVALIGIAGILGPDASMFGIDFYQAGTSLFILGLALLSVLLLRVRLFQLSALLWICSSLFGLQSMITGIVLPLLPLAGR